ncbi:uncharacterized protein DUF3846 [Micromonospora sp. Llam0]|uniref:DUF3846 domain-containing protein n=1 Tax=Micromonospora sp. Llam0 TaxID=2485143 RepID=UPI000F469991|nr:DUF3846 domain-containing protein [Micromonospora sp. Llam0]ROO52757.1 uncharacterized protein DUF3846 [Micromonospora sp. Llam0]
MAASVMAGDSTEQESLTTDSPFTYIRIAEGGSSHEHHARLRTGTVAELLRRAVGGWLESTPISTPGLSVWCDEDGPATGRAPNPVAGLLVARLGGGRLPLVGPVVVTGRRADTPVSLTAAQVDAVLAALAHCR